LIAGHQEFAEAFVRPRDIGVADVVVEGSADGAK
jgi:hypothetical protein